MANTSSVKFTEGKTVQSVTPAVNGISFIRGKSLRGPIDDPREVITSWSQFVRRFGGLTADESTLLVKRLLDKGGQIRFSRMGHYTTISNRSTLSAVKATPQAQFTDTDEEIQLFDIVLKYPGADYNNIVVQISAPSNGTTGYFNLSVRHLNEPDLNENYQNLRIEGNPTAQNSNYLLPIIEGSELVDVVYKDLSTLEAQTTPKFQTVTYAGGTDGGTIIDSDIIGDSASSTGFYSFDNYDDSLQIFIVAADISDAVHIAGSAYAAMRKDLQYWIFLSTALTNREALVNKRASLNIDSKYTMFFQGGLSITDPNTSQPREIEGSTDVAALAANSDVNFGPWYSFAGNQRGIITNALGVITNFGTPAKAADLNILAQRQINSLINRDGSIKLWNLLSAQISSDQESYSNVVRGKIFIIKSLRPVLENYLEQPNDIPTWKTIYYSVTPFLDSLVTRRALFSYRWLGDQDASSIENLTINKKADVLNGKYKAKLLLSFIPAMREIEVEITLVQGVLTFDEAVALNSGGNNNNPGGNGGSFNNSFNGSFN